MSNYNSLYQNIKSNVKYPLKYLPLALLYLTFNCGNSDNDVHKQVNEINQVARLNNILLLESSPDKKLLERKIAELDSVIKERGKHLTKDQLKTLNQIKVEVGFQ